MSRSKKKPKQSKLKAARQAQQERQALRNLWEKRRPFEPLLRQIVSAVLHAETQEADANPSRDRDPGTRDASKAETWVEVGCGIGQLRSLLPSDVQGRMIHTDLSASLVGALVERFPEARALAADVTRLPFEAESVDVVLGLCAFDSFSLPEQASREIGRVLREGGRFVHFLDAATNVEPLIVELMSEGRLLLPNFLADVALRQPDLFDPARMEHLIGPYHDALSVPLAQFRAIVEMLQRTGHPLAAMLHRYSSVFSKEPFELLPAARTFVKLSSDPATGRPMNQALTSLYTTLQQPAYAGRIPFELRPHASLDHFKARLEHYFGPDLGYRLRLSSIVYARSYELDDENPVRARVRRVGVGQNCVNWPTPLGIAAHRLKPGLDSDELADVSPDSHVLREAAVYCLVSEKAHSATKSDPA